MSCQCQDEFDEDEYSDFECPDCGDELGDDGTCENEECIMFECDPFGDTGGAWTDDAKAERQQMGITS